MDAFIWVLEAVLILLGIGIVGFWIARRQVIPENFQGFLSQLAINIALPCLVFSSILVNFSPEKFPNWWQLPLWWFAYAGISLVLSLVTSYVSNKATRSEFIINLFFQNGLFFPLIIIGGVFGQDAPYLTELYIFIIIHPIMFFSSYPLFFRKSNERKDTETAWHRIINPILVATILAIGVQLIGVKEYLPEWILSILETLAGMALPLIMIILGSSLYLDFKQKGKIYYKEIAKFLVVKNIVFPLAMLGILVLWKPSYSIALLFFLQAAVPPVTATPILTERVGGNKSISNQFVLASFVFSIVTVPATFHLFSQYFPIP